MIPLPPNGKWTQPNNSDKFGSISASKNISLDEDGYLALSPRSIAIYDEATDGDFGMPAALGRTGTGEMQIATSSDANWNAVISITSKTFTKNSGTNEPTLTINSHGKFFGGLWHATSATALLSKASLSASATWTSRASGLTSGVRHYIEVFKSRNTICVTNGNVIKQYDSSYAASTDLTIPADFEAIGLAYNNEKMAIITRVGSTSQALGGDSYLFVWDGSVTNANQGVSIGSDSAVAICAYKSSFAILCRNGQLLYWNGGGFDELALFPFAVTDNQVGTLTSNICVGDSMYADGDNILVHFAADLNDFGRESENQKTNTPSGIWCFNPSVGFYHRYSPSISKAYVNSVTDANVNLSTNVMDISAGTIPATGNIARYTSASTEIGGLSVGYDYYIIKVSATTFKLAATKALALDGVAIDLTSKGSGGTNSFWMYDLTDFATTYYQVGTAASIGMVGQTNLILEGVYIGGDFATTSLAANDALCMSVPFLENRGWFITPAIYSDQITDTQQKLLVRFRRLKESDAIIVKYKEKELDGLPMTSPNGKATPQATWTSPNSFYTTTDLSGAIDAIAAGYEVECEIVAGAGAGTMVQIDSIASSSGTYSVQLSEDVIGAAAGLSSYFIVDNWKYADTVDVDSDENDQGFKVISIGAPSSKVIKYKIELRGYKTTIEGLQIINDTASQAQ